MDIKKCVKCGSELTEDDVEFECVECKTCRTPTCCCICKCKLTEEDMKYEEIICLDCAKTYYDMLVYENDRYYLGDGVSIGLQWAYKNGL